MNTQNKNMNDNSEGYQRRICLVEVACSSIEEYNPPGMTGAYVYVVADAENEIQFLQKVRETLENEMNFPVIEISEIELLTSDREISEALFDSIENLLPHFPIAFGTFHFFENDS